MTITELDSQCTQGMNEQLLKTSGADVLSSGRKLRKTLGCLVLPRVNIDNNSNSNNNIIFHTYHISYILYVHVSVLELMHGWLYSLVSGMES